MRELLRTNDLVRLSYLQALLTSEGIEPLVLDGGMSVLEGSAGAIPRRLMVASDDFDAAKALLEEAGETLDPK